MNRRKLVRQLSALSLTGLAISAAGRLGRSHAAAQVSVSASSVYFKSISDKKFRKIAMRFDISGTNHKIVLGEATCGRETFTVSGSSTVQDSTSNMTYVSVIYVPKTPPAGDSPLKSGGLADISVTITVDNMMSTPNSRGPVIDIDPCASR